MEPSPSSSSGFSQTVAEYGLPILCGALAFFLVMGGGILDPTNIAWMAHFDPAQYYLGWAFFRDTPWMIPPGASPRYGMEIGSSIYYTDSIPLLALPAKALSAWLPVPFQYWGWWVLLCFILQAIFGWKLAGLITPQRTARLAAMGLFLFSPPFLFRMNFQYSFGAQWLLLASLYLCFGPREVRRQVWWPVVVVLAAGIHSYLFAMVLLLWATDLARRLILRETRHLAPEILCATVGSLAMLWLAGFFVITKGLRSWGLGDAHMNLLSLINPNNYPMGGKWSYVLPSFTAHGFDYEGFNFLGLGLILFFALCLLLFVLRPQPLTLKREWWPLALLLVLLTIFALSNRVALGGVTLFTYWLPEFCEMLRSSGRMFWPVFYVLLFLALRYSLRRLGAQFSFYLWALILTVQILDTGAGWRIVRAKTNAAHGTTWDSPLQSEFWKQARYQTIYRIPLEGYPDSGYQHFAYYALLHGMSTDAAYLARYDPAKIKAHRAKLETQLTTGQFESNALYVLDDAHAELARKSLNPATDALEKIDGYWVLAPGGRDLMR